jgi:hypothetical protein
MSASPDRVDRFQIRGRFENTFGADAYIARDPLKERDVLVWLRGSGPHAEHSWTTLARAGAVAHSETAVAILEAGSHADSEFVLTALPAGTTVIRRMAQEATWPVGVRLQCFAQLCSAVEAAHRQGLVFGSVRPDAIYIDDRDNVQVVPARLVGQSPTDPHADLRYLSPEQLDPAAPGVAAAPDYHSDIFVLGAVLYFLLTGRHAFDAESRERIAGRVLHDDPTYRDASLPIPEHVQRVLATALAKAPTERYQSVEQLRRDVSSMRSTWEAARLSTDTGQFAVPVEATRRPEDTRAQVAPQVQPAASAAPPTTQTLVDSNVQFTVYRPKALQAGRWHPMLVFAHLTERRPDAAEDEPDPIEEVARQAGAALGAQASAFRTHTEDSGQDVPREGELTFVPHAPGVDFNPSSCTLRWIESVHRADFHMRAAEACAGQVVHGRVTVYLGSLVLAEIGMALRVESRSSAPEHQVSDTARSYRRIFASYSHRDSEIVDEFQEYAKAIGDRFLRDTIDLRAGETWQPGLERLIAQADVFQLFWSWNAMGSAFVQREWEYALSLNRRSFVRPVYWDEPMPAQAGLPPPALTQLHFERIRPRRVSVPAPAPAQAQRDVLPPAGVPPAPPLRDDDFASAEGTRSSVERSTMSPAPARASRSVWKIAMPALAAMAVAVIAVPIVLQLWRQPLEQTSLPSSGGAPPVSSSKPPATAPSPVEPPDEDGPITGAAAPNSEQHPDTSRPSIVAQPEAGRPTVAAPGGQTGTPTFSRPEAVRPGARTQELLIATDAAWRSGDAPRAVGALEEARRQSPADPAVHARFQRMLRDAQERLARAQSMAAEADVDDRDASEAERHREEAAVAMREGRDGDAVRQWVMAAEVLERALRDRR